MGVRLMVEVLDHAPAALTPRERWALIAIAEDARDETRLCLKGVESNPTLIRRMRAGRSERAAIVAALIAKGALERVKRGQMHQHAVFRIPPLAPAIAPGRPDDGSSSIRETRTLGDSQGPENPDAGASQGPDSAAPGSGNCGPRVRETRTPSPQSPQNPSSLSGPARTIADATGATPEETREILFLIKRDNNPRNPAAYVRTLAKNGDLPALLEQVRAEAAQRAARRTPQPPPEPEPEPVTATPGEREAAIAAARALLQTARTRTQRGQGGPRRLTPRPDVEPPPEVQAAHAYLLGRGDAGDWLEAARSKLGTDAERGEVLVLAAELART